MAFEDKKGIVVASPFKLQAEALLDVRQQVDTIAERDRLVTLKAATAGLRVFVKENSTSYVYTGSKWDPLTTGAPYKHPTGDGNHHVPATGTTNAGKYLKAGATAGSEAWSKIAASDITGLPTKLPNPKAIKFTGAATGSYDGSSELTVNIPTSGTTDSALIIQMNGGTTEGNNKFTFNGSAAKNINITPANIGAAASTHSHNYAGSGSAGGAANSAVKLATARTINGVSFDGTSNIEIPNNHAKALNTEDLNAVLALGEYYAGEGNTVKNKPSGIQHFGMKVYKTASGYTAQKLHGSDNVIYYRVHDNTSFGAWQKIYSTVAKPTAVEIGAAPSSHTHPASQITALPTKLPNPQPLKFTGAATATYDGSGAVTVNIPTAQASPFALTVQLNGGTSEGTNKFTFNGGSAKTINITPVSIGAALSVHTHPAEQITGLPTSLKNPHTLTIKTNGTVAATYDGSVVKEVNITPASIGAATSSHNHIVFKGASASAVGGSGFVPAPAIGEQEKYLRGDGTWQPISLTLAALGVTASATELNYMKGVTSPVQSQLNGKASSSHTHNLGNGTTPGFTKLYKWEDNPSTEDFTGAITSQFLEQYTTNKILPRIIDNLNSIEKIKDGTTSVGKAEYVVDTVKKQNIGITYDDISKTGSFDKCKFAVYYDNNIIGGMTRDRVPEFIGASPIGHHHTSEDITDLIHAKVHSSAAIRDSSNQNEITISYNEVTATSFSYIPVFTGAGHIGNIGKSSFLTQVGAAPKSHAHNYAGSSSAGGPANSAKKVDVPVGTVMWSTSSSSTFFAATMGGTWEVVGNIDAIIDTSTNITFYLHKKKAL